MSKVATKDLAGAALDYAVALARGLKPFAFTEQDYGQAKHRPLSRWVGINVNPTGHDRFNPSEVWDHGGPIIEEAFIAVEPWSRGNKRWAAKILTANSSYRTSGPTPSIAAMRCYVLSRLGDEVDIPEELL